MDDRHSACTDAQGRFTSKEGRQGRMDADGSTEPPVLANQVSEGAKSTTQDPRVVTP